MSAQSPEQVVMQVTPERAMLALTMFRERYQNGLIPAATFNELVASFQFLDQQGHYWSPGVNSGKWYSWDGSAWTAARPPALLYYSDQPFTRTADWISSDRAAMTPAAAPSPKTGPRCACGAQLTADDQFCPDCGSPVRRTPDPLLCSSCHSPVPAGKKFCPRCGTPVSAQAAPRTCTQCGALIADKKLFCTKCGTPVRT